MKMMRLALALLCSARLNALILHHVGNTSKAGGQPTPAVNTFENYYANVRTGRGIWKWSNALTVYQRHLGKYAGKSAKVAEVGVQSGGSLLMWKSVLGQKTELFGFDINPKCKKFSEHGVAITIGDQADPLMWQNFFKWNPDGLDVLVDDGGHQPHQMLTTLTSVFPHIRHGGYVLIEDMVNSYLLDSFFKPTASFLAQQAQQGLVESVHLYPMVLVVHKCCSKPGQMFTNSIATTKNKVEASSFAAMWTGIYSSPPGTDIILKNPQWGSLMQEHGLFSIFSNFIDLHSGKFKDNPPGCATTSQAICTNEINPTNSVQNRVAGVHVYPTHVLVEVASHPPVITATRKGTEWITYS